MSQLRIYGLAVVAGLAVVGSLRAAELLLSPLTLIVVGWPRRPRPRLVSVLRQPSARRLGPYSLLLGAIGAVAALCGGRCCC